MENKGWMKAVALAMTGMLTLTLLGCGSQADSSKGGKTTTNSSDSATSSTEPAKSVMSKKEAGEYYERLVEPINSVQDDVQKAYYEGDIVTLTDSSAILAKNYDEAAVKIESAKWPDKAVKYAQKVAADCRKEADVYRQFSSAASMDELESMSVDASDDSATAALRKVLNLPAAPAGFQPFSSPGGEYTGTMLGSDYGNGKVVVKNDLGIVTYAVTPTITFLDADGNSLGETYPQSSTPVQPGASISVDFLVSPEITGKIKHIKVTSVNWHRGSADSTNFYQAPVEGKLIDVN